MKEWTTFCQKAVASIAAKLRRGTDDCVAESELRELIHDEFPEMEDAIDSIMMAAHETASAAASVLKAKPVFERSEIVRLDFQLIEDAKLELNDRIVFSFLSSWSYWNAKDTANGRKATPITMNRFRKATGFRPEAIKSSFERLQRLGYVDALSAPNETHQNVLGHRTLRWAKNDDGIRLNVFRTFVATDYTTRHKYTSYWWKSLGISRATFFRWAGDKTKTGSGIVVTDETNSCNG